MLKPSRINRYWQPNYPEFLCVFALGALLYVFGGATIYQYLGIFFAGMAGLLAVFSHFYPKSLVVPLGVLLLLAMGTGVLQFNYLPSLTIWLLIFTRLILINKQFTIPAVIITLCVAVVSLLTAKYLLSPLMLLASQQFMFNLVILGSVSVATAIHLWRLVAIIEHYRLLSMQSKERLTSLVTMTNRLTRYLPSKVWQPILKNQNSVDIISQRRKLTILLSDIVGFTDLSDRISPDHLANILNTYFDRMTQITLNYGATLDKFIGDGMLCYFGDEPNSNEREDALKCVRMAIEMRREMQLLRRQWQSQGFDGLHVRVGINTGYCYVGNFGSRNRMTYTVIGKEANLAARLESTAQKDQILISETTYNLIKHKYPCELMGEIQLKGLQQTAKVWQVLDPNPNDMNRSEWVDYHLPGFNLHLNFQDIRNYDRQAIIKQLNAALTLVNQQNENS